MQFLKFKDKAQTKLESKYNTFKIEVHFWEHFIEQYLLFY